MVNYLKNQYITSERRACRLAGIARRVYSYQSCRDPQTALRLRMKELAMTRMRYGYRKIGVLLKREGFSHSMGMLYRVYREEGLSLRYRPGRRSKAQVTRPQRKPATRPNQAWSLDFVADQLPNGNRFRCLTIVDVFTRAEANSRARFLTCERITTKSKSSSADRENQPIMRSSNHSMEHFETSASTLTGSNH